MKKEVSFLTDLKEIYTGRIEGGKTVIIALKNCVFHSAVASVALSWVGLTIVKASNYEDKKRRK